MEVDREYLKNALTCNPLKIFNKMMETDSGKIAWLCTMYVLKITLIAYLPLAILCVALLVKFNYLALPLWLVVILSTFPFAKYVIIPLLEKEHDKIEQKIRG